MQTLHGFELGKQLRALSDSAQERVWIVSPYIGRWPAVSRLLGGSWWTGSFVDFRVITDLSDQNNVKLGTLAWFADRGKIATLPGVHAKIYIVDDRAILTSANLTETAFTKRREIGLLLSEDESVPTIDIFKTWWSAEAKQVSGDQIEKFGDCRNFSGFDEDHEDAFKLKPLWSLPSKPADHLFDTKEAEKTGSYAQYLQKYKELAQIYEARQRLWADAPLFLEVDAFLNFLFHGDGRPSEPYKGPVPARSLSEEAREAEIDRLAPAFAVWLSHQSDQRSERVQRLHTVQNLLAKDRIDELDMEGVNAILDCIHAMGALPWPRMSFLGSPKNTIENIRDAWAKLLFGTAKEEARIETCRKQLYSFGPSSTQELLGCFYPDRYPLKNDNSDAGLRYLGYAV